MFEDLDAAFADYKEIYETYDGRIWNPDTDPDIYEDLMGQLTANKPQIDAANANVTDWSNGISNLVSQGWNVLSDLLQPQ